MTTRPRAAIKAVRKHRIKLLEIHKRVADPATNVEMPKQTEDLEHKRRALGNCKRNALSMIPMGGELGNTGGKIKEFGGVAEGTPSETFKGKEDSETGRKEAGGCAGRSLLPCRTSLPS